MTERKYLIDGQEFIEEEWVKSFGKPPCKCDGLRGVYITSPALCGRCKSIIDDISQSEMDKLRYDQHPPII